MNKRYEYGGFIYCDDDLIETEFSELEANENE